MGRNINTTTLLDTKPTLAVDFNKTLIITTAKKIEYQTVESAGTIVGAESGDEIYKKVEAFFGGAARVADVDVYGSSTLTDGETLKTALDKLLEEEREFLFFMLDKFDSTALTKAAADWGAANGKIFAYLTSDEEGGDEIDRVTAFAATVNKDQVIAVDGEPYLDAKLIGFMTTTQPGYLPWSWREKIGSRPSKRPLADQKKLQDANINYINKERRGIYVTYPGKTASGEFVKNIWGKMNMEDDMHIAIVNLLKSNNPPGHPGADLNSAPRFDAAIESVIIDYASDFRKFIATWSQQEVDDGITTQAVGMPKMKVKTKTEYQDNDIRAGKFEIQWTAIPRGECISGSISGLLTFDTTQVGD